MREVWRNHEIEIVSAEVATTSNTIVLLCSCYRPPSAGETWLNDFYNLLADVRNGYRNIVLAGDFNMQNILWDLVQKTTNKIAFIE